MVRRTRLPALLALLLTLLVTLPASAAVDPSPLWRPRLLVVGVTDVALGSFGLGEGTTLTVADTVVLAGAADLATERIRAWSDGRVAPDIEATLVPGPIATLRLLGSCGYVAAGRGRDYLAGIDLSGYDGVLLAWRAVTGSEPPAVRPCWGGVSTPTRVQGYTSIQLTPVGGITGSRIGHLAELLVHEWLHQVEFRLLARGMTTPPLDGGVVTYGYTVDPSGSWAAWYRDVMTGRVVGPDGRLLGIGDAGWRLAATPRTSDPAARAGSSELGP